MADGSDTVTGGTLIATPEPAPVTTPAITTPVTPVPDPAPIPEPVTPVTPQPDKPIDITPEPTKPEPEQLSLLDEAAPKEEPKPEATPEPVKPEPYKFTPYTIPEGFKAEEKQISALNEALTKEGISPQERGQSLIDLHVAEMKAYDKIKSKQQFDTFKDTQEGWRKQVLADPELGGAGHKTAMQAVAQVRDEFVSRHKRGTDAYNKDMADFSEFLKYTGGGNHPAFLRMMHNIARWHNEPAPVHAPYQPPADIGRKPNSGRARLRDNYKTAGG